MLDAIKEVQMSKLGLEYQSKYVGNLLYDPSVLHHIDATAKLHEQTLSHPLSSSAACLNVLGSMLGDPIALKEYLNTFGLEIDHLLPFPSGTTYGGRKYADDGYVVFEWVGPQKSPINEQGGSRGQNRTSVDAFVLAVINGKCTQVLIEWKFTEGISRDLALGRFSGQKGIERYKRYTPVLAKLRKEKAFPFAFEDEYIPSKDSSCLGLHDLSADHFYQLLRMTLLARKTTPSQLGQVKIEDYRIVHLSHSENQIINTIQPEHVRYCPGLGQWLGKPFHETWQTILSSEERTRFRSGFWDNEISSTIGIRHCL